MELKKLVVPFELKQSTEDKEYFTFKGYASTFGNIDRGLDVVEAGAFEETIQQIKSSGDMLPVLWQHNHDNPVGVFASLSEDGKGLLVEGKLPLADTFVSGRIIPQMKVGSVRKMSIGYSVIEDAMDEVNGRRIRKLKRLKLWEISLVTIPMNNSADITDMKAVVPYQDLPLEERSRPWDSAQAIARIRQFTDSDDEPSADYKKAFLWYDSNSPDEFGSYKLPIADVVFGRMRAIPRGIFAAAAALRGARGGVDIPDADRPGVERHIERYYEKMGLESPFSEKGFRIDDFCAIDVRDLESLLKSGVFLSRQNAKAVASLINCSDLRDEDSSQRDAEMKELGDCLDSILTKIKG